MTQIDQTPAALQAVMVGSLRLDVAKAIAQEIRRYWHSRGYPEVETRVEPFRPSETHHNVSGFVVRSNLVNGLPPSVRRNAGAVTVK
jgi:hypothetical protein